MPAENRPSTPKAIGADFELANFITGRAHVPHAGTGDEAALRLLAELPGVPAWRARQYALWSTPDQAPGAGGGDPGSSEQDRARRFLLENGGCAYCDLSHAELCIPEVTSARDFVAAHHAMLRIAQRALARAQQELPEGETLEVLVNNSEGQGHSYGAHLNFLVTRSLWDDLMWRRPHYLGLLASHQVSSIVYTGQGKVGSENGRPPVGFQLAQRADFFETLVAPQTTHARPIVNSRDEALCGDGQRELARLHHIFSDAGLAQVASFLKVGTLQLVLAMLEAGDVALDLLLDDPVAAVVAISHDATLQREVALAGGGGASALALQRRLLERAMRHHDRTGFPTVPGADAILDCWEDTLARLGTGELAAISDRLDWAAKRELLELARAEHAGDGTPLGWDAPELKHLDLLYASLDPARGLYWAWEAAGAFEPVVSDAEIERFTREPPEDTRAWTRAMLLRRFGPIGLVERVDWDRIVIAPSGSRGNGRRVEVLMPDPCGDTRADNEHLFTDGAAAAAPATGADAPEARRTT